MSTERERAQSREGARRWRLAHPRAGQQGRVPPDWITACDQCYAERWPWAVGSIAQRNWCLPGGPQLGCTHPRQRADGKVDWRWLPRHLRPPDA